MSPFSNRAANLQVETNKRTSTDDETDEGFVSPSVQRTGLIKNREDGAVNVSSSGSNSASDTDNQTDSSSSSSSSSRAQNLHGSDDDEIEIDAENKDDPKKEEPEASPKPKGDAGHDGGKKKPETDNKVLKEAGEKAESLAQFVVNSLLDKDSGNGNDRVERTLLRCVRMMMQKHEILFKGMMRRLQITRETGYISFVTVANTLFEDDKMAITWSRIVALYTFGGQLALYCRENDMEDFTDTVPVFMGRYSREVLAPYVCNNLGGWEKICDEFPDENEMENKISCLLSWAAVGLGVAATVSYLTTL